MHIVLTRLEGRSASLTEAGRPPTHSHVPTPASVGTEDVTHVGGRLPAVVKRCGRLLWSIAAPMLIGALTVFAILVSVIPAVMGWVPLTILTGSMAPSMPSGSLVVVSPLNEAEAQSLSLGTVITYMPNPDDDTLVTHRILSRSIDSSGEVAYSMKGDANASLDASPVRPKQIRGIRRYWIPFAGHLTTALTPQVKALVRMPLATCLVAYALWHAGLAIRERRHLRRTLQTNTNATTSHAAR